jgi:predicted MFS family arabinose efflux permease
MLTRIALPLTALLALDSGPLELGFLAAVEAVPMLVVGLLAGVWVDRLRRRPLMIAADLTRAALLLTVPAAALAGALSMGYLYAVAAIGALFTALFDAAYPAYLPGLVGREHVVDANSKLSASASVAEMGGFAAGGSLVQLLGAPIALLVDAATFVVSALSLAWIRSPESAPPSPERREGIQTELAEGLAAVVRDPALRALVGCSTTMRLAGGVFGALYVLYAVRDLQIAPAAVGVITACGGIGSFVGALMAAPALSRLGPRATLLVGFGIGGAFQLLIPFAHGSAFVAGLYLTAAQVFGDCLMMVGVVNDTSLRQSIVPDRLLGRVSATANALGVAAMPVGALAGGLLGELASPRAGLAVGAAGLTLSCLWFAFTPMRAPIVREESAEP